MITPIETAYAGHRFRSRLEARWAVFMDALGITWEYEAQGYEVGPERRPYLPDFWLPDLAGGTWVEVKGAGENLDTGLLEAAVGPDGLGRRDDNGDARILILGPVPEPGPAYTHIVVTGIRTALCAHECLACRTDYSKAFFRAWPKEPGHPPKPMLVPWGHAHRNPTGVRTDGDLVTPRPNEVIIPDLPVQAAYKAARSARFEHGESGAA